ncbi:FAD-dependent monooxygenase [Streptomyces sp. B21-108]|uniref:FAD-dependent monooxygenase n=1 Tax=Streptomyces sp. B21-108 TaxID=3039419 RepID=UPI002FF31C4B
MHLGTEVTDVRLDDDGAAVDVVDAAGRPRTVRTRYVLACDGGASPSRRRLGLRMDDLEFDQPWLVVDLLLRPGAGAGLPRTNVQYCEPARPSTFVVGPGNHRRWEFMINPGERPEDVSDPDVIRALLSRWLDPGEYDLWRASTYRFHALVLKQWRVRRLFLLGDAAHMTPPFLAQGMCQGIRDASNLMWKLALRLRAGATTPCWTPTSGSVSHTSAKSPSRRRSSATSSANATPAWPPNATPSCWRNWPPGPRAPSGSH